jgi:hypothetical protein
MSYRILLSTVWVGVFAATCVTPANAGPLNGPMFPYESFNDSPFKSMSFTWFDLVDMTALPNGPFSTPGVTVTPAGSATVIGPGGEIDSVDGMGNNGHSLFSACGACGLTFTFDAAVLGSLPTAAGIAWTDGVFKIHFSAVDANGNSLGQINDATGCDFTCGDGDPSHFRFFDAIDPVGIKSITISNDGGGIEVDHLQFGLLAPQSPVPEPSTMAVTFLALGALLAKAAVQKRQ